MPLATPSRSVRISICRGGQRILIKCISFGRGERDVNAIIELSLLIANSAGESRMRLQYSGALYSSSRRQVYIALKNNGLTRKAAEAARNTSSVIM